MATKFTELGGRIKKCRQEKDMNQSELAEILRDKYGLATTRETVSKWEIGFQEPTISPVKYMAEIFNVSIDYLNGDDTPSVTQKLRAIRVPVLGRIPAGTPIDAIEDILDWEELDPRQFNPSHDYFALLVIGDSMFPKYLDGDIVIVQESEDAESGKDVVAIVNGNDATLKKLIKYENGNITLQPLNIAYNAMAFTPEDIDKKPVVIRGFVRELRRKV